MIFQDIFPGLLFPTRESFEKQLSISRRPGYLPIKQMDNQPMDHAARMKTGIQVRISGKKDPAPRGGGKWGAGD
jgi:hypothetical protein